MELVGDMETRGTATPNMMFGGSSSLAGHKTARQHPTGTDGRSSTFLTPPPVAAAMGKPRGSD